MCAIAQYLIVWYIIVLLCDIQLCLISLCKCAIAGGDSVHLCNCAIVHYAASQIGVEGDRGRGIADDKHLYPAQAAVRKRNCLREGIQKKLLF